MKSVVTFGELMLKLSPLGYGRFVQSGQFNVEYSGAEANVAVSLCNFGIPVRFVTALPKHELGDAAVNTIRRFGVDTTFIARSDKRLGIYFAEKGASQRPSKVIYDRADTAIANARPADFDWDAIFEGVEWFHFSGITPALSDGLANICLEACRTAKAKGVTISCDLNYRKKLWSRERAKEVMTELSQYVDVCIANEEDASDVFGITAENTEINSGMIDSQSYTSVARQLQQRFNFQKVAITLRESISASDNNWSAILFDGRQIYTSRKYSIHIVDRIGGGDSFGAGLIYGLNQYGDCQKALEFAVAASCLKQTIEGDFNLVSKTEVDNLMNGNISGRIQR